MKDTSLGIHARRIGSRWPRIFRSEGRKSTFYIAKEDFHRKILTKALNFSSAMGIRDNRGALRQGIFKTQNHGLSRGQDLA
jgi:hypothetical protein